MLFPSSVFSSITSAYSDMCSGLYFKSVPSPSIKESSVSPKKAENVDVGNSSGISSEFKGKPVENNT